MKQFAKYYLLPYGLILGAALFLSAQSGTLKIIDEIKLPGNWEGNLRVVCDAPRHTVIYIVKSHVYAGEAVAVSAVPNAACK